MSASQSGVFSVQEFADAGTPLVGGRLYTYSFGTTTQKTAYTDAAGTVPHTYTSDGAGGQYIALNSRGELPAPLYLTTGSYDLALKRADGSSVWTRRADGQNDYSSSTGSSFIGFLQSGTGAVTRTVQSKLRDSINVKDFGALFDGATDDTTSIQNAINAASSAGGGVVFLPVGTTLTQQITIPSNVSVLGSGKGTIVKPTASFALNAFWVVNASALNWEVGNFQMQLDKASYASTVALYVSGAAQYGYIHDLYIPKSGSIAIYAINALDVVIERVQSLLAANCNIQIDGASSQRVSVMGCWIDATGVINHGIQFLGGGADHRAERNYVQKATIFGISFYNVNRCIAARNTVFNTTREGINVQDGGDCIVTENSLSWDSTTSQDFGLSVFGQSVNGSSFHLIRGNKITNSGKSGIALAASTSVVSCRIDGNMVINSNRLNNGTTGGNGGGIIAYGTGAQSNELSGNTVFDSINNLQFGYYEWNNGGTPSNNRVVDLKVQNAAQATVNKSASSTEAFCQSGYVAWNPTISSGTGAISTVGTVVARYLETDRLVNFMVTIPITTNGTGAGTVNFTLPFTVGPVAGVACGRENALTGSTLNAQISAGSTTVTVATYNNTYPGANGAVIEVSGHFIKA